MALSAHPLRLGLAVLAGSAAFAVPAVAQAPSSFENPASHDTSQQFTQPSAVPGAPPANVQRQDTPNDPDYDFAEPDTKQTKTSSNLYDERFDLFGFPSAHNDAGAIYKDGPNAGKDMVSGYNAAGAWKIERGRPDVTIAILDTGIKWDNLGLRDKIHLDRGELPLPEHANGSDCAAYDCNGDGAFNVDDYAGDPRVSLSYPGRTGPANLITGQDLIHAFGNCKIGSDHLIDPAVGCPPGQHFDNDGNGYANDIAGWNFFDDTNDPTDRSSYFAASNHGTGRASDAAETGNDGQGSIGVCPHCQVMPIRVWDTFVSDGNTFGLGITYATDNGAQVIEGADGSLYHSAFAEHASQYAYDHGVVQTYSGDDLNTANHNYPGNYGHAMLIQGTVPDTVGLGMNAPRPPSQTPSQFGPLVSAYTAALTAAGTDAAPKTYFRGSNTTQYGGKSSISMEGPTGSINTGRASGGAALVVSAALDHGITLHPDETREILEQTAERVTTLNTQGEGSADPGAPSNAAPDAQWTTHFGWGRANLGAAVSAASSPSMIPPEAAIDSPDWYAPVTGSTVRISGLARARFADGGTFHWKLLIGSGLAPSSFTTVREGDATRPMTDFGTIDLSDPAIQSSISSTPFVDTGGPTLTDNPFTGQFTVQLEVTAKVHGQPIPLTGIDRRVLTDANDSTLRPGYPKRLGTGGEAPIRYADLNGDNVPELIVPTEDGTIHAYEPDGSELRGWPVHTQTQFAAADHLGAPGVADAVSAGAPPREPPRGAAVADLDGTGRPSVIDTAGTHVYVWNADGTPRAGFPVSSRSDFCGPQLESQPNSHPKCGFLSSPAIAHLEGFDKPPDIVIPALDGHVYAFQPDGRPVPHFPVALVDPTQVAAGTQVVAESINEPAIADLTGSGHDDIVAATNETYGASNTNDVSFAGALGGTGQSTRVYAIDGATGSFLSGWPISISGILQSTLPLIGPGNDPAVLNDPKTGKPEVVASATSGSLATYNPDGTTNETMRQEAQGAGSDATDKSAALNLFESAAVGKLAPAEPPAVVKYEVSLGQATNLLLVGQNQPYNHLIGAFDATTGQNLPSWPTITDDYQFLSSSTIAKVDPNSQGNSNQVLAGTGLGLLHAYDGLTAQDAPQFPKVTGGWLFSPAALSDDGRLADITREGFLFEWTTQAPHCGQTEWPSFRHDPQQSGNYNHDGTPPDAMSALTLTSLGGGKYHLAFKAPGDDGPCGTPKSYVANVDGQTVSLGAPVAGGSSFAQDVTLPGGAQALTVQAQDAAGNLGYPVVVAVPTTAGATSTGAPVGAPSASNGGASSAGSGPGGGSGSGGGSANGSAHGGAGAGGANGSGSSRGHRPKGCLNGPFRFRGGGRSLGPVRLSDPNRHLNPLLLRRHGHGILSACVRRTPRNLVIAVTRGHIILVGTRAGVRGPLHVNTPARRIRGLRRVRGVVGSLYRQGRIYMVMGPRHRVAYLFTTTITNRHTLRTTLRRSQL